MKVTNVFCPRGTVVEVVSAGRVLGDAVVTGRIVVQGRPYYKLYHIESSGKSDLGYLPIEAFRQYDIGSQVSIAASRLVGHWLVVVGADTMPWRLDSAVRVDNVMCLDVSCVDLATDEFYSRIVPACGTFFTQV